MALGVCFQWILVVASWVIVDSVGGDGCAGGTWRLGADLLKTRPRPKGVARSNSSQMNDLRVYRPVDMARTNRD